MIRRAGGTVEFKPEPDAQGSARLNYQHVAFTLDDENPFNGPEPNPVPKNERITFPGYPYGEMNGRFGDGPGEEGER